MKSIVYIGMDVHKENYTLCSYTFEKDSVENKQTMPPDYKMVLKYAAQIRKRYDADVVCGYEAGCLGYTLYHQLKEHGVECVILAPTTMGINNTNGIKTDKRDAANIAKCLAFNTYSPVYIPTLEDESVKEYIRMRDSMKKQLKVTKQQILALLLRQGKRFGEGSNWTLKHVKWLKSLDMGGILQECLSEYLIAYDYLTNKIERLDERIEELATGERYAENVKKLSSLLGVKTHTAMAVITEVGDFKRFEKPDKLASFLGLVPGEYSSGSSQKRGSITKAGNSHVRKLLTEAAQAFTRGQIGYKSKELKHRQKDLDPQTIAYADKANERLRRRFYHMTLKNKTQRNVAATAIARELACFMWGLMTGKTA